jgi:putative ABC transport system permease protein
MLDLRFAVRQLGRVPGFTAVVLLTLAVGIGACTAIFSVVNSVLLRPMPYPESDHLVYLRETKLPQFPEFSVAAGTYLDWKEQSTSFETLTAIRGSSYNLTGMGDPVRVVANRVTANYFATLRSRPALGRDFAPEEDVAGNERVVILSHGFWQRQFGGRPEALQQAIQLNGQSFTVIGIMPKDFQPGSRTEIFTPMALTAQDRQNRGRHNVNVTGRLKRGVTVEQARRELAALTERLINEFPNAKKGWGVKITPMLVANTASIRPVLLSLLGAAGFLLLIACANIAHLLLARASVRSKEIAVRAALGADRARIVRQLLSESMLLGLFGGLLGVLVAHGGISALLALVPDTLPRAKEIAVDGRAFAFACALAVVTGIAFGLLPAFQATRVDLNQTLKEGGRGSSEGGRRLRLRGALVVAEVAIALVLLVGAGLLIRSFTRLQQVSPGFQPQGAVALSLSLSPKRYGEAAQRVAFVQHAVNQLASLPGVTSVGASQATPFNDDHVLDLKIQGRPQEMPRTNYYAITPGYLPAMGIPVLRGRGFTASDAANAPRVALINETLARKFFAGEDPIGKRIHVSTGPETWREIVGVVGDVKQYALDKETTAQTYEPFAQSPFTFMTIVIRGSTSTSDPALRTAIYAVDKEQPVASIRPLTAWVADSVGRQRFGMTLFAVFAGVALLLAAIGIYGVMAYSVSQRTREIGIRMALGAHTGEVLRLALRQGSRLIAMGLGAGLVGALLLTHSLDEMLYGVSAHDPLTFAAIAVLLSLVAGVACLLPARRAAKVSPMTALRAE